MTDNIMAGILGGIAGVAGGVLGGNASNSSGGPQGEAGPVGPQGPAGPGVTIPVQGVVNVSIFNLDPDPISVKCVVLVTGDPTVTGVILSDLSGGQNDTTFNQCIVTLLPSSDTIPCTVFVSNYTDGGTKYTISVIGSGFSDGITATIMGSAAGSIGLV